MRGRGNSWAVIGAGTWFRIAGVAALTILLLGIILRDSVRDWLVDDTRFSAEIRRAAEANGVDPALVRAVIFQESRFDPFACGTKGEVGLMQVLPGGAVADYARQCGGGPYSESVLQNPVVNLQIGCWYLSRALRRWQNEPEQIALALCQYNAGEKRAVRWSVGPSGLDELLQRISIESTRRYVKRILARYEVYRRGEK